MVAVATRSARATRAARAARTGRKPVTLDHLGDAYWRVGRQLEAQFQWRRSLGNKPDPELKTSLERKLKDGLPTSTSQREN